MGIVFEVEDALHGVRLAQKTLYPGRTPTEILRLKNEFRMLADVTHPNLVGMRDLFVDEGDCFFTMDLVPGVDFLLYVDDGETGSRVWPRQLVTESGSLPSASPDPTLTSDHWSEPVLEKSQRFEPSYWSGARETRLRSALRQLVDGVLALHGAGLIHRDLKPSNVLVTEEGRVVILDFGITRLRQADVNPPSGSFGTPAYVAPEQATGGIAEPASDWYSVGVMLHQALLGYYPFGAPGETLSHLLSRKQREDVTLPEHLPASLADLTSLCERLLRRDPARRPTGNQIAEQLRPSSSRSVVGSTPPGPGHLVGRHAEYETLLAALSHSREKLVTFEISGAAGIGKSALVAQFLRDAHERQDAVVLRGRCHEHENVPFKAFDGIIDSLRSHLDETAGRENLAPRLPADWGLLASIFPVLRSAAEAAAPDELDADPHGVRRRAFRALREALTALAERRPVVLWIDDVHWSDTDSASVLGDLLGDDLHVLLIVTYRPMAQRTPFLEQLASERPTESLRKLELGPLSHEEGQRLALELLGPRAAHTARVVADEASGSPFFICQMAHYATLLPPEAQENRQAFSIRSVVQERIRSLPDESRQVLEVVALAGRRLPVRTALHAAGHSHEPGHLRMLERLQLVQVTPPRVGELERQLSIYHDKIRETLVEEMNLGRSTALHLAIADAAIATGEDDFEAIAHHYSSAGRDDAASGYFARAAVSAERALAFERAAALYRRAVETSSAQLPERDRLRLEWASALIRAGRGTEAAEILLDLATRASGTEVFERKQRAAELLMWAGQFSRGIEILSELLASVGRPMPKSSWHAWMTAIYIQTKLRFHDLGFVERDASECKKEDLLRLDTFQAAAWPLSMVDLARATYFTSLGCQETLRLGEPTRVARVLASYSNFVASVGISERERAQRIADIARDVAQRTGDPVLLLDIEGVINTNAAFMSEYRGLDARFEALDREYSRVGHGNIWQATWLRAMLSRCLAESGQWAKMARYQEEWLAIAKQTENRYFASTLLVYCGHYPWLAADDPDAAETKITEVMQIWRDTQFNTQRLSAEVGLADIELYRDSSDKAFERLEALEQRTRFSLLRLNQTTHVQILSALGNAAVAQAAVARAARASGTHHRGVAKRCQRALEAIPTPFTRSSATLIRAGLLETAGQHEASRSFLREGILLAEEAGRGMVAAAARWQLGGALGHAEGSALRDTAEEFMREQGVKRPDRVAHLLCPGFGVATPARPN